MRKQHIITRTALMSILIISAVVISACGNLPPMLGGAPATGETAAPPEGEITPAPVATRPATEAPPADSTAVVDSARRALAQELGVKLEDVRVVSVGQVDWPNGCLGIETPGLMCTDAIVPGYQIILEAGGKPYEYRSDLTGRQVVPASELTGGAAAPQAALTARTAAAAELGVQLEDVRIVSAEQVEWSDACLGVPDPLELCAQAITPGYRVVLEANGQQIIYHTDETGQKMRRERQPGAETPAARGTDQPTAGEGPVIALRSNMDGCFDARVDLNGVTFGECGEEMASSQFPAGVDRLEQLTDMQRVYSSFGASTPAGKVTFVGKGPIEPTPVEQRMIAEWASLVAQEVRSGPGVTRHGLVWQREGGIAGFCDDLTVETGGHAVLRSCKDAPGTAPSWRRLTSEELNTFYGWIDQLGQVAFGQEDAAVADALTIRGLLSGRGTGEAAEAEKASLPQFVSDLLEQWAETTPVQTIDTLADIFIRQAPGEQFEALGTIAAGQQVLVTGVNRDSTWWRVICPDSAVARCWVSADATLTQPTAPAGSTGREPIDETGILSAVIRQVYTVDDTFGGQGNFTTVYLLAVDDTESGAIPYSSKPRSVPAPVQQAVLAALADLPSHFEWIATAGEAPRGENNAVEGNGAIITVGNLRSQPDGGINVAASIYAGMLAAGGQTYLLELQDGIWKITGTTGAAWIS